MHSFFVKVRQGLYILDAISVESFPPGEIPEKVTKMSLTLPQAVGTNMHS